jgi:hypothetical protein
MGQAKRRKAALGDAYGTPEGSNCKPLKTGAELLSIHLSEISGKWGLYIDIAGQRQCLTVYYERSKTEANMAIAANVFNRFTVKDLEKPATYHIALNAFIAACQAAGYGEDDDEPIAAVNSLAGGQLLADVRASTLRAGAAYWREHDLLSDAAWDRIVPTTP